MNTLELEKVACFITREKSGEKELLLFEHPHAGIQLPAGTVDIGEQVKTAAIREMNEETGIKNYLSIECIGNEKDFLKNRMYVVLDKAFVYSRANKESFNWACLRRGIKIEGCGREKNGFVHIMYEEWNDIEKQEYITYKIQGWIKKSLISEFQHRYFYHIKVENMKNSWIQKADNHKFKLFWANITELPLLASEQNTWLKYIKKII